MTEEQWDERTPVVILAEIRKDIDHVRIQLERIEVQMVTKDEYRPIKILVFGFVGIALTAIVGALFSIVINSSGSGVPN